MNITKNEIDALNFSLAVKVEKADYDERVTKVLRDYKNKSNFDGFRPGKVPMGLVKKKYGVSILVDEMNKIISESLGKYLQDTEDKILGEPMPFNEEQKPINWGEQEDYEFMYRMAIAPEFEVKLTKRDKFNNYTLKVEKKDIDSQIDNYKKNFGEYIETDNIEESNMITGNMAQVDSKGEILDGGIVTDNTSLLISSFKDDKQKELFLGKKNKETITFNPKISFENTHEIASLLKVKHDEITEEQMDCEYKFTIDAIKDFKQAENNKELWEKVFGKDTVKTEKEFIGKIEDGIKQAFIPQSDYKFTIDAKEKLVEKTQFDLPETFLKEWVRVSNAKDKLSDEKLEEEFPMFLQDLRWQLIKDVIAKENDLKVSDEDLLDAAKAQINAQFQQYYGAMQIPEEHLLKYAQEIVEKPEERRNLAERKIEEKAVEVIKTKVKLDDKAVTTEEFNTLFK